MKKLSFLDFVIIIIIFAIGIICRFFMFNKDSCKLEMQKKVLNHKKITKKKIPVTVTVYNPTIAQCDSSPLQTADGSIIDSNRPQRWCGVSRDLLKMFSYGENIELFCPLCPYINGSWTIHDTGAKGVTKHVDLLISNPNVVLLGGKWDGFIIIDSN